MFFPQQPICHELQPATNKIILIPAFSGAVHIQPHDNRIVVTANARTTQQELEGACQYLRTNFGGKILVNIPKDRFEQLSPGEGFSDDLVANPADGPNEGLNRIRAVRTETLKQRLLAVPSSSEIDILDGDVARQLVLENAPQIVELMKASKFKPEKIADYERKGRDGIAVLMQGSNPVILRNRADGKIIGLCNLSTIGGRIGYISDTLMQPDSRINLIPLLYKMAAEIAVAAGMNEIKLIVPSGRIREFERYGFVNSNTHVCEFHHVFASFTPPGQQMGIAYDRFLEFAHLQQQHQPTVINIVPSSSC